MVKATLTIIFYTKSATIFQINFKMNLCTDCGKSYDSEKLLKGHMKYVHQENKKQCNKCPQVLPTFSSFNNHMEIHKQRLESCKFCKWCKSQKNGHTNAKKKAAQFIISLE